jgi:formylglycine-generating enzyme required for sulfatase activity
MTDTKRPIDDLRLEKLEEDLDHYTRQHRETAHEHRTTTDPQYRINLEAKLRDLEKKYAEAQQAYQQLQGIRKFKPKLGAERNYTARLGWGIAALLGMIVMFLLWQLKHPPQVDPALAQAPSQTKVATLTAIPINTSTPTATAAPPTNTPTELELALSRARAGVTSNAQWQTWYPDGFNQTFDGIEMVLVPTGCFHMGNDPDAYSGAADGGQQCFDEPFWISRYEVTQAQYEALMGENPSFFKGANLPIEQVTWFDAREFAAKVGLRLPTETEWEYATRGPDGWIYPWGNKFVADQVVYDANSGGQTAPVGSRPNGKSWVSALDLSGNVWEWTLSAYADYPYVASDGREANLDNTHILRVLRGGSWINPADRVRGAYRSDGNPVGWDYLIGFRLARSL